MTAASEKDKVQRETHCLLYGKLQFRAKGPDINVRALVLHMIYSTGTQLKLRISPVDSFLRMSALATLMRDWYLSFLGPDLE